PDAGFLARRDSAVVSYDADAGTCTSYCHGSGASLLQDTAPGINRTPRFNGGTAEAACGSCHGTPPQGTGHPGATITTCAGCHRSSVTSAGNIIVNPDGGSTHIDGRVSF